MRKHTFIILSIAYSSFSFSQTIPINTVEKLSRMPLKCIPQEWPNKTSHLSTSSIDHVLLPSQLHPTFYGCLDWHSSVHGHWLLLKILKDYPTVSTHDSIYKCLNNSFQSDKITEEAAYFTKNLNSKTFERTYGWAWLLKLDQELLSWDNVDARRWHKTLQPLTTTIVKLWKDYLPKQSYPNRTGVHPERLFTKTKLS